MNELVHQIAGGVYAQVFDWWHEKPEYIEPDDTNCIHIVWTYKYHNKRQDWHMDVIYEVVFMEGMCRLIGNGCKNYEYADQSFPGSLLEDLANVRAD